MLDFPLRRPRDGTGRIMGGERVRLGRRSLLKRASGIAAGGLGLAGARRAMSQTRLPDNLLLVSDQRPVYGGVPRRGGTLRMVRPTWDVADFNPTSFRMDYQVAASYLEPLLRPDDVTMEPRPGLAESWDASSDGREITYRLRDGVEWHDGSPLSADDIAFSFEAYRDDLDSGAVNLLALLDQVEPLDNRVVRVRLLANDPTWLFNASSLPMFQAAQYRAHWEGQPEGVKTLSGFDWRTSLPIGTGPWRLTDWTDRGVWFARNETHWDQPPWLDRLEIAWETGDQLRLEAWESGEADILWPFKASSLENVGRRSGRLYEAETARVMFAAFNFANPDSPISGALDDPNLRRALTLAIDRQALAADVFGGFARPFAAGTVAQPWAHDDSLRSPRSDRAEAGALLEASGWSDYNGDGILERVDGLPLSLVVVFQSDLSAGLGRVLSRVKLDLVSVGVDLQLQPLSPAAFDDRWRETRDYDLIAYAYDLYPAFTDYDLYGSRWDIRRNAFGWNPGGYANPRADTAVEAYLEATSIDRQRQALLDLQQAVDNDLFGLWFGFPNDLVLVASDLLGFQPNKVWQTANTPALWRSED